MADVNFKVNSVRHRPSRWWSTYLATALMLCLTYFVWMGTHIVVQGAWKTRVEIEAEQVRTTIESRLMEYRSALLDLRAHFSAVGIPSRLEFQTYIDKAEVERRFPGLQGIAFAKIYRTDQEGAALVANMEKQGYEDFKIYPENESKLRSAIMLIEPLDWRNRKALGYDMTTDATRKAAMVSALTNNDAKITRPVHLVQEGDDPRDFQYGFLVYLPMYRDVSLIGQEQLDATNPIGTLHAVIRIKDFINKNLGIPNYHNERLDFSVSVMPENPQDSPIEIYRRFENAPENEYQDLVHTSFFDLYGITWKIEARPLPHLFAPYERNLPEIATAVCILFLVLSLFIFWSSRKFFQKELRYRDQLAEFLKRAEDANKTKTAFLANMSHEIRTPLGAIIGFSEMLLRPDLSEEERNRLSENIKKNGSQLTRIIDDILDISKVEAGKLHIELIDVDLEKMVSDLFVVMGPRAKSKGLELNRVQSSPLPRWVRTDEIRVKQILTNLLSNAIRFTENGSVTLRYGHAVSDDGVDFIEFFVEDTGVGISKASAENLFQPFTQGDVSSTRRFGGTGLGLALTKKLAQLLGGDATLVKTTPNLGSVFCARVPLLPAQEKHEITRRPAQIVPSEAEKKEATRTKPLTEKRILLVEDSPDNQSIFKYFLNSAGASVDIASDGEEAIRRAFEKPYDLVLMDIQIPKIDGLQATKLLREKGFEEPIVALTAHAQPSEVKNCLDAGCVAHLTKPISGEELIQNVAKFSNVEVGL